MQANSFMSVSHVKNFALFLICWCPSLRKRERERERERERKREKERERERDTYTHRNNAKIDRLIDADNRDKQKDTETAMCVLCVR